MTTRGYREIPHTADWALRVWAPTFVALLREAARGMYELAGVRGQPDVAGEERHICIEGDDPEELLVSFLSELVYLWSVDHLIFPDITFDEVDELEGRVSARLLGVPIASQGKEIKAVTYHGLDVDREGEGLSATVTFDV